jgi:ferredoxin-NADP reductase
VRAPAGGFTYPGDDDRPIALLAGGIGITPLISMLRHAVLTEPTRPVTLIYSARRESDFAFRDELALIAARHPQVKIHYAASREARHPEVYPGRIDRALLGATVADLPHTISLICGPQAMIDELTASLHDAGVPAGQVRSERFEAAVAVSSRGRATEGPAELAPDDAVTGPTYRLRAVRCAKNVPVTAGQTLLEAAEAHGIAIDSLCRAGVCGTCRTRVVEGDVDCDSGALDDDDRAQGFVLACVAAVRGDCAIEA